MLLPVGSGDAPVVMFGAAVAARSNATALFQSCSFRRNAVLAVDGVSVMEVDPTPKTVSAAGGPAAAVVAAQPADGAEWEVWDYTARVGRSPDEWTNKFTNQAGAVDGLRTIQAVRPTIAVLLLAFTHRRPPSTRIAGMPACVGSPGAATSRVMTSASVHDAKPARTAQHLTRVSSADV